MLDRHDGGDPAGAVAELTGGHVPVGPGALVAMGLGVGGNGETGAAYGLAELLVAEAGQPGRQPRQVRVDRGPLGGVEVGHLTSDGEGLVLADLTAAQGGVHSGQVVAESAGEQDPLLALVGAGASGEPHLRADRQRASRPTPAVRRQVLDGPCGVGERGGRQHLRSSRGGLDPLQRLELVEQCDGLVGGLDPDQQVSQGVQLVRGPGGGTRSVGGDGHPWWHLHTSLVTVRTDVRLSRLWACAVKRGRGAAGRTRGAPRAADARRAR